MDRCTKRECEYKILDSAHEFSHKASIELTSSNYKTALIFFCLAIELLFKARILNEDWKKIVLKKDTKLDDFIKGNFESIKIKDCLLEIKNMYQFVSKDFNETIIQLFNARNKVIHFYNPSFHDPNEEKKIARLICKSWYLIYQMFKKSGDYLYYQHIFQIHDDLCRVKEYLRCIYSYQAKELQIFKEQGRNILDCSVCGLDTCIGSEKIVNDFDIGSCLVCEIPSFYYKALCKCGAINYLRSDDEYCVNVYCEEKISLDRENLINSLESIDAGETSEYAYCNECDTSESIGILNGQYLCGNCLFVHEEIYPCDYCAYWSSNYDEDSCINGCSNCGGIYAKFDYYSDKD